jgi:hypothetical protein
MADQLGRQMTTQYLDVALTDLHSEFELARSKPRHLVPQPRVPSAPLRAGLGGVLDSLLAAQHVLPMFRRALPNGSLAVTSTDSSTASPKSSAKRASSRHPENGQRLADNVGKQEVTILLVSTSGWPVNRRHAIL